MSDRSVEDLLQNFADYRQEAHDRGQQQSILQEWLLNQKAGEVSLELLEQLTEREHFPHQWEDQITEPALVDLAIQLLGDQNYERVLDPTCGSGYLLKKVACAVGAKTVHGVEWITQRSEIARKLCGDEAEIYSGDLFSEPAIQESKYDLIIAEPPMGVKLNEHQVFTDSHGIQHRNFDTALIGRMLDYLDQQGKVLLFMAQGILFPNRLDHLNRVLESRGASVRTALYLPPSPHRNGVRIGRYLLEICHGETETVFTGEYSEDQKRTEILIENCLNNKRGSEPALGWSVPWKEFYGFPNVEYQWRFSRFIKKTGWSTVQAKAAFTEFKFVQRGQFESGEIDPGPSGIFLKPHRPFCALSNGEEFFRKNPNIQRSLYLEVNPQVANRDYLIRWLNRPWENYHSFVSCTWGRSNLRNSVTISEIKNSEFVLPSIADQELMVDGHDKIDGIQAELRELESALWGDPENIAETVQQIESVNQEDHFEDWNDTLPFPLASVLWRYHTAPHDPRKQLRALLHFFETFAAFMATVHLSAYQPRENLWQEFGPRISDKLNEINLSLKKPTFGTWKFIMDYLGSKSRKAFQGNKEEEKDKIERIYATQNSNTLKALFDPQLNSHIQNAIRIRNQQAHGGAMGRAQNEHVVRELKRMVDDLRGSMGRFWKNFELIQAGSMEYCGDVYQIQAKKLMGNRQPFASIQVESKFPLKTNQIYLFDKEARTGLHLLPLIIMGKSPEQQNICYIYNRAEANGPKYVSYHYEAESEFSGSEEMGEDLAGIFNFED